MKTLGTIVVMIMIFFGLGIVFRACAWTDKAIDTAAKEVDPAELLRKYTWFKDASAQLDRKLADIKVYDARVKTIEKKENPSRSDSEQMYVWMSEVAGIKASYNGLAAEYNAQMSKANWAFCNVGMLPPGATVALPREYKSYIEG